MNRFFNFASVLPIPAGLYHAQSGPEVDPPYRIHLRLQSDGSGILILNASTVLHLNATAAEYAYHFVNGNTADKAATEIAARYRVKRSTALRDFQNFTDRLETLAAAPDLDPVSVLDFDRVSPHAAGLTAPLRLDCALTYRLPAGTQAEYAPARRVDRELGTDEWSAILDKAWQVGIPHVTFTGGEATLRDDLVGLVAHAEAIGQVCGLLTDGLRLIEKTYRGELLQAGLDHVLLMLQPARPESWAALEAILAEDIFVTVHLTVNAENESQVVSHLRRLASSGAKSLSLTFAEKRAVGSDLQDTAASLGLALKHDLPVPYASDNPVTRETQVDALPSGAGRAWLYVEPDGDVLAAQGMSDAVLGNFLRDPWERIFRQ